jgi:zinc transporter, ZIP family
MSSAGAALGWGLVVGGSLVAGALAAAVLQLPARAAATLTSFGGGVLLAAVALELVPEADAGAGAALTAAGLLAGTLVYVVADRWLTRDEDMMMMRRSTQAAASGRDMGARVDMSEASRGEAIAAGLFVDGVPESIALGLTVAEGEIGVALLAGVLVGNVVEAYGAAHPIVAAGRSRGFAVRLLGGIAVALVAATILGGTLLADVDEAAVGFLEAPAVGAVLAVVLVSIVPHAFAEVSRWVAAASAAGFLLGFALT